MPLLDRVEILGLSGSLEGERVGGKGRNLYSVELFIVWTDEVTDWGRVGRGLCLYSRRGFLGRWQGLFSCCGPCLGSWGCMGVDWGKVGMVISSLSWRLIYGVVEHIAVLEVGHVMVREIGRLAEEGGGSVIFSIFSIRTGSLGSCCSGLLTSGAATEAGGS